MTNTRYLHGNMHNSNIKIYYNLRLVKACTCIYFNAGSNSTPNSSLNDIQNAICILLEALQDNIRGQFNKI